MKVSWIVPTANPFVPKAILHFLAPGYADDELIILDDRDDSIADLAPGDARTRYLRETGHMVGAKRNAPHELAPRSIIGRGRRNSDLVGP
jgi:hypothetical protein